MRAFYWGPSVVLIAVVGGCAASPVLRDAKRGDLPALRDAISAREKAGDLTNSQGAAIAKVTAERQVREAKDRDAEQTIRSVRACAREIDGALAERMKVHDPAGAEAALARLEAGELEAGGVRRYARDADDGWRAVGVRGLTRAEDRGTRQKAMQDAAPRVRREAARAAQIARDPADLAALCDAARVDPEPIVRTEAVRAIALLAQGGDGDGGTSPTLASGIANRLRDLWVTGDDGLREDIAIAWASPSIFTNGGREALALLIASDEGPGSIEAAAAVLREFGSANASNFGETPATRPSLVDSAAARVTRAIESGARRGRLHAIAVARVDRPDIVRAIVAASNDNDSEVRVAALARLIEVPARRSESIRELERYAALPSRRPGDPGLNGRAKIALSEAGDVRIQSWLEADLHAPDLGDRVGAASDLAILGRSGRAAPLLADPDSSVRTQAACILLVASRTGK